VAATSYSTSFRSGDGSVDHIWSPLRTRRSEGFREKKSRGTLCPGELRQEKPETLKVSQALWRRIREYFQVPHPTIPGRPWAVWSKLLAGARLNRKRQISIPYGRL
jgi:hypothetical protein